jgi:hypothetical protein
MVRMSIAENLEEIRGRIARAALRAGRRPEEVTLCAVTKTVPPERVREAAEAGIRDLGENYFQEAREKLDALADVEGLRWHFIGHLQSNKARSVVGRFALIHSLDSLSLAAELDRRARAHGVIQPVLIEVRLDEAAAAKSGAPYAEALGLAESVSRLDSLRLDGLMGIPPLGGSTEEARPHFARLRALFERLPTENRRTLSMGMTGDFEAAVEEGATLVRIGTALFGSRISS